VSNSAAYVLPGLQSSSYIILSWEWEVEADRDSSFNSPKIDSQRKQKNKAQSGSIERVSYKWKNLLRFYFPVSTLQPQEKEKSSRIDTGCGNNSETLTTVIFLFRVILSSGFDKNCDTQLRPMDGKRKPETRRSSIEEYHGKASIKGEQRVVNSTLAHDVHDLTSVYLALLYFIEFQLTGMLSNFV
jgi:hypothetical protein